MYRKNRKDCTYCRYERCLAVGMSPHLILSEEEKQRIFKKYRQDIIEYSGSATLLSKQTLKDEIVAVQGCGPFFKKHKKTEAIVCELKRQINWYRTTFDPPLFWRKNVISSITKSTVKFFKSLVRRQYDVLISDTRSQKSLSTRTLQVNTLPTVRVGDPH